MRRIFAPLGVICFSVLIKIADDIYKITTKLKSNIRKVFRFSNAVEPLFIPDANLNQVSL